MRTSAKRFFGGRGRSLCAILTIVLTTLTAVSTPRAADIKHVQAVVEMIKGGSVPVALRDKVFDEENVERGTIVVLDHKGKCYIFFASAYPLAHGKPETQWLSVAIREKNKQDRCGPLNVFYEVVHDFGPDGVVNVGTHTADGKHIFGYAFGGVMPVESDKFLRFWQDIYDDAIAAALDYRRVTATARKR